jgi:hypothetical protein
VLTSIRPPCQGGGSCATEQSFRAVIIVLRLCAGPAGVGLCAGPAGVGLYAGSAAWAYAPAPPRGLMRRPCRCGLTRPAWPGPGIRRR